MAEARSAQRRIGFIYVGLADGDLAVARVASRVLRGGHAVPEEAVRRRYVRSLANLAAMLQNADVSFVYDNSSSEQPYQLVARTVAGSTDRRVRPLPAWFASIWP